MRLATLSRGWGGIVPQCSTPLGITARGTRHGRDDADTQRRAVLNASRHHGEGDELCEYRGPLGVGCSTPLGITARGTTPRPSDRNCGQVLNASRHHGEGDW